MYSNGKSVHIGIGVGAQFDLGGGGGGAVTTCPKNLTKNVRALRARSTCYSMYHIGNRHSSAFTSHANHM